MRRSHLQTILLSVLLASCAGASANAQAGGPEFAITTKNTDDQINVQIEGESAIIDIQSPSGIGMAAVQLESGVMPREVILRLHLKGLEQVRLSAGDETVSASVSSAATPIISQTLLSSGVESSLLPENPAWLEIEVGQEGFFEIRLPTGFLQKAGTSFTVEWVDFYR